MEGLAPNNTVTLRMDDEEIATYTSDSTGKVDASFTFPSNIATYKLHLLSATDQSDGWTWTTTVPSEVPGDINKSGCVDDLDLFLLIQDFFDAPGAVSGNPRTDLNSDGFVDDFDLFSLWAYLDECKD